MSRTRLISMTGLLILASTASLSAWPMDAYDQIFGNAIQTMPEPLQRLLADMDSAFREPCDAGNAGAIEQAAANAIEELSRPGGDLCRAVPLFRLAACATAALNDLEDGALDRLVEEQKDKFAVVFYGWHPLIREGDLAGYVQTRHAEHERLRARFGRTAELPSLSEQVELSPEFGLASIAFSHAVTDVANVWMYIWASVNGAR